MGQNRFLNAIIVSFRGVLQLHNDSKSFQYLVLGLWFQVDYQYSVLQVFMENPVGKLALFTIFTIYKNRLECSWESLFEVPTSNMCNRAVSMLINNNNYQTSCLLCSSRAWKLCQKIDVNYLIFWTKKFEKVFQILAVMDTVYYDLLKVEQAAYLSFSDSRKGF